MIWCDRVFVALYFLILICFL